MRILPAVVSNSTCGFPASAGRARQVAIAVTAIRNERRNIGLLLEGWNGTNGMGRLRLRLGRCARCEQVANQRELGGRGLVVAIELGGAIVFGSGETRVNVAEVFARDRPVGGGADS